jgi:hypothetical protein
VSTCGGNVSVSIVTATFEFARSARRRPAAWRTCGAARKVGIVRTSPVQWKADGTPKTVITASPMNFSTVPPCDSTIAFIRSKKRASSARSASGSIDSPSVVDPVTSQKRSVTVLRISRGVAAGASAAP